MADTTLTVGPVRGIAGPLAGETVEIGYHSDSDTAVLEAGPQGEALYASTLYTGTLDADGQVVVENVPSYNDSGRDLYLKIGKGATTPMRTAEGADTAAAAIRRFRGEQVGTGFSRDDILAGANITLTDVGDSQIRITASGGVSATDSVARSAAAAAQATADSAAMAAQDAETTAGTASASAAAAQSTANTAQSEIDALETTVSDIRQLPDPAGAGNVGKIPKISSSNQWILADDDGGGVGTVDQTARDAAAAAQTTADDAASAAAAAQTSADSKLDEGEVDARVTAGVIDTAATGNTDRWAKTKLPSDTAYDADLTGFLNQAEVDSRVQVGVIDQAETGNTDRWAKNKLPSDTVYDADISGFLNQSDVDARVQAGVIDQAETGNSLRWEKAKLPTDIVYATDVETMDALTQAQYDAITNKSTTTLYIITG